MKIGHPVIRPRFGDIGKHPEGSPEALKAERDDRVVQILNSVQAEVGGDTFRTGMSQFGIGGSLGPIERERLQQASKLKQEVLANDTLCNSLDNGDKKTLDEVRERFKSIYA